MAMVTKPTSDSKGVETCSHLKSHDILLLSEWIKAKSLPAVKRRETFNILYKYTLYIL